jgi:protein-tyrosine phosphatase
LPGVYHNAGPAIRKATKELQDSLDQEGIALQLATGAPASINSATRGQVV